MVDFSINDEISIKQEIKKSYLDYAMSVIVGRALPDVRDGLKPVHRRILVAMLELINFYDKPFKKSARVVGDVIGKYHPHGDNAVYNTMVRMTQDFSMRYPLIDGQGNFGSVDGDPPAAMRYTEVRMTKISYEMLQDLDKDSVLWLSNYDGTILEPSVLPTKVPNLLINGSSGIAVGMATNIPPHNLGEIIEGLKYLIDNPGVNSFELLEYILGPDFPTGGSICDLAGMRKAYTTGKGILRIRANINVEICKKTDRGKIIVTEIPYQVNKARLIKNIAFLVKNKKIDSFRYIRDESDRDGMRIVLGLKKGQLSKVIINQLYKYTQMEISFGIIFLVVANKQPMVLSIKHLLNFFINHRKIVITNRTKFELEKAKKKSIVLEGLKIAVSNLDNILRIIKKANSTLEAKHKLVKKFRLSELQAQAILDMRLNKFTSLETEKIKIEYELILKKISNLTKILDSKKLLLTIIKEELEDVKLRFSDFRRTNILYSAKQLTEEDVITREEMVVTISNDGYIKRSPIALYKTQGRGGRGKKAMITKSNDFVTSLFVALTHHYFLFFTSMGKVYWCKVYDIPISGRYSKGKSIVNFLNFSENEKMTAVLNVAKFIPNKYVFMATRKGIVKKSELMLFSRPRSGGIIAIKLVGDDELISVRLTDGSQNIFLGSSAGKSIRFHESDVRRMGRNSSGVIGMKLAKDSYVVAMEVLNEGKTLFAVTENGFGKRTFITEYPIQKRGGKGVITIKTSKRNGNVVAIILTKDDDDIMLITSAGKLIRISVNSTSIISRNTQGVKLIVMEEKEKVVGSIGLIGKKEV